ncbi:MAG: cytidine deaminase [Bacteroidaceae bacterium]|nr:cytidine deaminase [Bacteroidaceae bacterium]
MKSITLTTEIKVCAMDELSETDRLLVQKAQEATLRSYAPYSHFRVGASVQLEDGTIVTGTNQENAAYPSGLCAERTALFYANSQYPDQVVTALAIASRTENGTLCQSTISPCGACRQVMVETEKRFGKPIKILLCGTEEVYIAESAQCLLPLSFDL